MAKYGHRLQTWLHSWWWVPLGILLFGGYWLLPISGQVVIKLGAPLAQPLWPQISASSTNPQPGDKVTIAVTDNYPWPAVVLTVDGQPASFVGWQKQPSLNVWTWTWTFTLPAARPTQAQTEVIFYTACQAGCQTRGRLFLAQTPVPSALTPPTSAQPTKLCVAFADPTRDWHGRNGWVVDITYARLADEQKDTYWTVNELAARAQAATAKHLRVLVRVDYDRGQSLPPANDFLALNAYLAYVRRLAQDERLRSVYGLIIGSGFNANDSNALAAAHPVTAEWVARLLNGYAAPVAHTDNVVQTVRSVNLNLRVLVGPVRPWATDQNGSRLYKINEP